MSNEECTCGHTKQQHIYEEGACRPGMPCHIDCQQYQDSQPKLPAPNDCVGWYVVYTRHASMAVKKFDTREEAEYFAGRFVIENLDNKDDNTIDMIFEGTLHAIDNSFELG